MACNRRGQGGRPEASQVRRRHHDGSGTASAARERCAQHHTADVVLSQRQHRAGEIDGGSSGLSPMLDGDPRGDGPDRRGRHQAIELHDQHTLPRHRGYSSSTTMAVTALHPNASQRQHRRRFGTGYRMTWLNWRATGPHRPGVGFADAAHRLRYCKCVERAVSGWPDAIRLLMPSASGQNSLVASSP